MTAENYVDIFLYSLDHGDVMGSLEFRAALRARGRIHSIVVVADLV